MTAASVLRFSGHEARLAWRDFAAVLVTGSRRHRIAKLCGLAILATVLHLLAFGLVAEPVRAGITPNKPALLVMTGSLLLGWCLLVSQAIESVTRAFYARGDLDLVLSSPAEAEGLFAARIGGVAASAAAMAMLLAAPILDVLAFVDGPRWLAGFGVAAALGAGAATIGTVVTVLLFRVVGPVRTRVVAQVVAAIVGAAFAIAFQAVAILGWGDPSRLKILSAPPLVAAAPSLDSPIWLPARALLGDGAALAIVLVSAGIALVAAAALVAPRFVAIAIETASVAGSERVRRSRSGMRFRVLSPAESLRAKEWSLLRRDPWLLSQTLMRILYLIPAALLLWQGFSDRGSTLPLLVPILVMAAGQLAGGLAWLAISGEDAPDLVRTAPVPSGLLMRAKAEAVLAAVLLPVGPLLVLLAIADPPVALAAMAGTAAASTSATAIQLWFRSQARRSQFRRRQTSSRIATFSEAFSSILWACAAALAAQDALLISAITAAFACLVLLGVWALSPGRD